MPKRKQEEHFRCKTQRAFAARDRRVYVAWLCMQRGSSYFLFKAKRIKVERVRERKRKIKRKKGR
jgi:hypothetical protein